MISVTAYRANEYHPSIITMWAHLIVYYLPECDELYEKGNYEFQVACKLLIKIELGKKSLKCHNYALHLKIHYRKLHKNILIKLPVMDRILV